jgi:paraquat-inducible protein A
MTQDDEAKVNMKGISPREAKILQALLCVASLLLGIGLIAPMVTIKKFIFVRNTFSVLSGAMEMLKEGQLFLFVVVFGFSVLLPIAKLWVLFKLVRFSANTDSKTQYLLKLMHKYGRWSMLDVYVVAVLVVALKLGAIANVQVHVGLFAFAAAVFITMYVTERMNSLTAET